RHTILVGDWSSGVRSADLTAANGTTFTLGDGSGNSAAIRFNTHAAERGILVDPELHFGEAYMDGSLVVEQGSIGDVIAVILRQRSEERRVGKEGRSA